MSSWDLLGVSLSLLDETWGWTSESLTLLFWGLVLFLLAVVRAMFLL